MGEPEGRFLPRSGHRIPPTPPCSSRADAGGGTREHSGAGPERRPPSHPGQNACWRRACGRSPRTWGRGLHGLLPLDRAAAGRERMAGVVPASCGPAPDRHCRAGPRSCAPLSPPVAEHSRAAGLTGLPPTPACISPTARQVYTSLAGVVRVPQPWRLGDGPNSGPPTKEAHVRDNHLFSAAPEAPVGTIVSRRVPEDSPVRAALLSACSRSLTSSLDERAGAPITSSQQQGPSPGPSLSSTQPCSSAVSLPERTVPKRCSCRQPQPSGRRGHEVGRWVASTVPLQGRNGKRDQTGGSGVRKSVSGGARVDR